MGLLRIAVSGVYDLFARNGSGMSLVSSFPNNSATLGAQLTSNNVYFGGPTANAANGGTPVKLYAPSPWRSGSSLSHLDEATYPPGNPNSLMTPQLKAAESIHTPGPDGLAVLQDLGWTVNGPAPPLGASVQRIYGQDAIDTSLAISGQLFGAGAATAVVLARSDFFSDALAGGPLAAANHGPLLITPGAAASATLDPRVLAEIQRVLPVGRTVFVLGGPLALAPGIDTALSDARLRGPAGARRQPVLHRDRDRRSSRQPARGVRGHRPPLADALSAVPAAVARNGVILLTDGNHQAPETAAYLSAHPGTTRFAIGGPLAATGADPGRPRSSARICSPRRPPSRASTSPLRRHSARQRVWTSPTRCRVECS